MTNEHMRIQVLDMIESGQISPDEAVRLLEALSDEMEPSDEPGQVGAWRGAVPDHAPPGAASEPKEAPPASDSPAFTPPADPAEPVIVQPAGVPEDLRRWRRLWVVPMWIGVGFAVLSSILMAWALQADGLGIWFVLAAIPLIPGILFIVLGWQSRTSPWLHLRVEQRPGASPQRFAISFPLPLRSTAWFLRHFGNRISGLKGISVDEVLLAMGASASPENPMVIEVEDDEDGERVQVFIG